MPETSRAAAEVLARYAGRVLIGVLSGGASLLLRFVLLPVLGLNEPLLPLFPLILFSALIGGAWAGASCLLVGVVGGWYLFLGPPHSFVLAPYELGELVGTFAAGLIVLVMCSTLLRLVARANAAAERERIIAREFEHRMRNTLTLVQGISRRTFTPSRPLEAALGDFEARLQALSAAHAALLDSDGDGDGAELGEIATRILTPFGHIRGEPRIAIEGPHVMLEPDAATAIALALHELATNAVKYGALSTPIGKVLVEWRLERGRELRLAWRESGGPVVAAPASRGFGSQLIERNLAQALGGTAVLQFAPDGLRAEIAARLR